MRLAPIVTLICLLAATALAKEDKRRAQLAAAADNAMASLRHDVLATPIRPGLNVKDFLERTARADQLSDTLRDAEQIGGVRWIDGDTCEVQLEIAGSKVVEVLLRAAAAEPDRSPVPAEVLRKDLKSWDQRTFSATGASTVAEAAEELRPSPEHPVWLAVNDQDRRTAVVEARRDAMQRVVERVNDVEIGQGRTVADALKVPSVGQAVEEWLTTRPVVEVEFRDNLEVRITMAAPSDDLWDVFRTALTQQKDVPFPQDEADWRRLRGEVERRLGQAVGRAFPRAMTGKPAQPPRQDFLPKEPPEWVDDQIDVDGTGSGARSKLHNAQAAEADAHERLRKRIGQLRLDGGTTLSAAAGKDPQIGRAIERSLRNARTSKVTYANGGAVEVRVGLDCRDLWHELQSRR